MRHIIITGNVAAGKSWILNQLSHHYPEASIYPEFIHDDPLAHSILKARFNNSISALTFQNFIMDKWVINSKITPSSINIYERLPDDAVEVFAKSFLPENEYETQLNRLTSLSSIPSYKDMNSSNCTWIRYNNDPNQSNISMLISMISSITTTFTVIEVTSPDYYSNYLKRNREGERYSEEDLALMDKAYTSYTSNLIASIKPTLMTL